MKRVLLVDDNRELLELNMSVLSNLTDLRVEATSDSLEAAQLLQKGGFDLVVSDFRMPRRSGLDLVDAVRQGPGGARVPVIIMTGYAGQIHAKKTPLDNVHILEKPVSRQRLTELVLRLLEESSAAQPAKAG